MSEKLTNANGTLKTRVLCAAAKLFLQKGYSNATVREIAKEANTNVGALGRAFNSKEDILCALVGSVLDGQFKAAEEMLSGISCDSILFYAAETTLQLYIAESDENIRDLYGVAYSLPKSSDIIQHNITGKLEVIFKKHLPDLETKDFYELELASSGIMRNFMARPCDMYFTMNRKVARFLETTFKVYDVPEKKIQESIEFVKQFDYPELAKATVDILLKNLSAV